MEQDLTSIADTETHRLADSGWFPISGRGVLRLSGPDRVAFLQGLVSNDVADVAPGKAVYACLLTPQGKFLHDFFLMADGETILIDCEGNRADDLARRLRLYRLRSKVEIADVSQEHAVLASLGDDPAPAEGILFDDPRTAALGRRMIAPPATMAGHESSPPPEAYDRLRIALAVPDGSRDMEVGKAILLENNIDVLNGIAWDKGCYMGQELTARTRYRGLIKKRLAPLRITGRAPAAGTPLIENGVEVGEMRSSVGDIGLALVRLEVLRQRRPIEVDGATLIPEIPAYLPVSEEAP